MSATPDVKDMPSSVHPLIDVVLWVWFGVTALAVAYVAYEQFKARPGPKEHSLATKTMRWGWVLVTLYTGPVGFMVYWFLHRTPARSAGASPEPSLCEQAVESKIHWVAGDATGILVAALATSLLRPTMAVELIAEYIAGFAVGLFLFQSLCMKSSFGGNYRRAVWGTFLPEAISMNTVMAGMVPVMIILMSYDMSAMAPTSVRFWGIMSLAFLVSAVTTFPVNWWLVARGLKHGRGGEARARRCPAVSGFGRLTAVLVTLAMFAGGILLASRYGDFSMRAGETMGLHP